MRQRQRVRTSRRMFSGVRKRARRFPRWLLLDALLSRPMRAARRRAGNGLSNRRFVTTGEPLVSRLRQRRRLPRKRRLFLFSLAGRMSAEDTGDHRRRARFWYGTALRAAILRLTRKDVAAVSCGVAAERDGVLPSAAPGAGRPGRDRTPPAGWD